MKRHPIPIGNGLESKSQPEKTSFLTTVLIPIGSALVAALGLLVQNVPGWVTAIVIAYIAVVILLLAVPAVARVFRFIKRRSIRRTLARRYISAVRRFLPILLPHLEDSRSETVLYVWRNASNWDEGRRIIRFDYAHVGTLKEWFSWIETRLAFASENHFELICDELAQAIFQYTVLCEQAHHELEDLFRAGVKNESALRTLRQEWANARDKHNQTVKTWEDIAKNINHDAGENVCSDHFNLLKIIS